VGNGEHFVYMHLGPRSNRRNVAFEFSLSHDLKYHIGQFFCDSESSISTCHYKCFIVTTNQMSNRTIKMIYDNFTFVTFHWPIKVIQGPRLWCILLRATVNIFVYMRLVLQEQPFKAATARFSLLSRWNDNLQGHPKSNWFCGLWKPDINFQQC